MEQLRKVEQLRKEIIESGCDPQYILDIFFEAIIIGGQPGAPGALIGLAPQVGRDLFFGEVFVLVFDYYSKVMLSSAKSKQVMIEGFPHEVHVDAMRQNFGFWLPKPEQLLNYATSAFVLTFGSKVGRSLFQSID